MRVRSGRAIPCCWQNCLPTSRNQALSACFKEVYNGGAKPAHVLVPVRNLQFWIDSNILLVLKDAPFNNLPRFHIMHRPHLLSGKGTGTRRPDHRRQAGVGTDQHGLRFTERRQPGTHVGSDLEHSVSGMGLGQPVEMGLQDNFVEVFEAIVPKRIDEIYLPGSGTFSPWQSLPSSPPPSAADTVQLHRGHIMRKMGADSFAALVRMADKIRHGMRTDRLLDFNGQRQMAGDERTVQRHGIESRTARANARQIH